MEIKVETGAGETQEQFIARRDAAISKWLDRRSALEAIKPEEKEARDNVASILFPEPKKGTNRYHLNGGYAIKLVHGTTYTLGDKDKVEGEGEEARKVSVADQVYSKFSEICRLLMEGGMNEGEANERLSGLIKWKPELNEGAYLALDPANNIDGLIKSSIDEILTTKPASPQLTFETPKENK